MPPEVRAEPREDILVVDDDEGVRVLIQDSLEAAGYAVRTADSAAAAIAACRSRQPSLVLLDLQLKDAAGPALVEKLKKEGANVPFVVVTGQGDEKVAVEMMKRGALDYVMKDSAMFDLLPEVVRRSLSILERDRSLAAGEEERRRLESQILEISENERRQFGADLHDGIGQQLTAIELMCVGLKNDAAAADPELAKQMDRITDLLRRTIAQTRAMARGLAPLSDEPDALQTGLISLADQADSLGVLRCRSQIGAFRSPIDRTAAAHLFRIAQEAVNNAIKHSGATQMTLRLNHKGGVLRLEIEDNGKGLPTKTAGGLGLGLMRYRAGMIGATLTLNPREAGGLLVSCSYPLPSR